MLGRGLHTWRISGEPVRSSLRRILRVRFRSGAPVSSETASKYADLQAPNKQRGDTIVEVMIAIAVVSMVLVAAYVTTTHNINGLEDTQEHSEALQLAQAQLEFLHNSTSLSSWADHSCFKTDGVTTSGVNCKVDASGAPTSGEPQFKIDITDDSAPTFKVAITWDSLDHPNIPNNVTLYYQP